jgi:general nucleoside transport system permease protein
MSQNYQIAASQPSWLSASFPMVKFRRIAVALAPVVAALIVGGIILLMLGVNPLRYYSFVVDRGLLRPRGLQETLTRMIPLMLLGSALIVSFRASIWNLGIDGQFLLGTLASAVCLPGLVNLFPGGFGLFLALVVGTAIGALWTVVPALLRAYQGINEVISTLMMTFVATSLGSALIKLFFRDPAASEPQTTAISVAERMPQIPGTTVNIGIFLAFAILIGVHLMMTRTSLGMRLQILGLNVKAAQHAGFSVPKLTVLTFAISGALAGLAGASEVVGVLGQMRADWNPGYGFAVVPLVFLARMNGWAVIAFIFVFSILDIGSESAAVRMNVPQYYNLVLVGFILLFMALTEYLDQVRRWRTE